MANDNDNDDFKERNEGDGLDDLVNRALHDMETDPELDDEDPSDVYDDIEGDEDDYPPEQGSLGLAGAGLSHTISDEAGTRLDLTDIHGGALKPIEMAQEMKTSFLEYSMSVIVARALPDVRDGLKPVHRRILYAMNEAHIVPTRPHKKSAWTVGEVMGKYHPHGDAAIYDSMVRMAQDFSMRVPLVDGHGNFGSVDGDPPAAMRYTESRLTHAAMEMLRDLDKETVDLQPNYDESLSEPAVLPARFPNLLVNGSSGIAVGMATNIPPHNLTEVINAVCLLESIGRGGRQRLVVTEIPYQVNKGTLQEKIAQQVNEKRVEGISDMRDESNRKGMRIVIDLKSGAVPQVVLNNLYKRTQLQANFGVIDIALVDGVPRTLTLIEMLSYYIDHQVDVVTRRTQFDLDKAQKDLHIREGLLIAVDNIDEIVHIIRSSRDDKESKQRMNERFGLTEIQCEAILQMRLRRLTGLAREELVAQIEDLRERIAYYTELLENRDKLLGVIKDELMAISERFGTPRRTEINGQGAQDLDVEDLIAEEDMVVTFTHAGYVKRLPVATYRQQRRGGKGMRGLSLKDNDYVEDLFVASTHDYMLFFTNKGRVYRKKVHELPLGSRQARGSALVNVLDLAEGEHPMAVISARDFPEDEYLMFATSSGMVKKTAMSAYDVNRAGGLIAIKLRADDELVDVRRVKEGSRVILCSTDGKAIMFQESEIRSMGRDTSGVRGINLKADAKMLGMEISNGNGDLVVMTENGYGKRTPVADYPMHRRGGQGVFTIAMTKKKGALVACRVVGPQHELIIVSEAGVMIRVKATDISQLGRATQGVKIMNLSEGDRVASMARMVAPKKKEKDADAQAPQSDAPIPGQTTLDFAGAGAAELDVDDEGLDVESVDVGDEEFDESLLDTD